MSRLTVLVPAHNEEAQIGLTIESLLAQSHPADSIVVIADNCTDQTVAVARRYPVEVFETVANIAKKAGALNQGLALVLPMLKPNDAVLIMDADSALVNSWIRDALPWLSSHGTVSGAYVAREVTSAIKLMQHVEYTVQRRRISRSGGKVAVLSGAASIFTVHVLTEISTSRVKRGRVDGHTAIQARRPSRGVRRPWPEDRRGTLAHSCRVAGHRELCGSGTGPTARCPHHYPRRAEGRP